LLAALLALAGCATPPPAPPKPSAEEVSHQQRVERAAATLGEGLKLYDAGVYEEALKNLLVAMDSGALTLPLQIKARKHIAFIQCINNREIVCKEEFEKAFTLDPKFELAPAETGHPTWGPIYRLVKTEIELKKSGKVLPVLPVKVPTAGEKILADGRKAYEEGDYAKSSKAFQEALKESLSPPDRIQALKFAAFSHCLTGRTSLCRGDFEKILQLDPGFELDAAEAGHPSWGPSFRAVKSRLKQPTIKK
jgi:tetratricopeptide (TPR) repeat protein